MAAVGHCFSVVVRKDFSSVTTFEWRPQCPGISEGGAGGVFRAEGAAHGKARGGNDVGDCETAGGSVAEVGALTQQMKI